MSLQLRAAMGTAFEVFLEKQRQIRVEFAVDVRRRQISFTDSHLIAGWHLDSGDSLLDKLLPHHFASAKQAILHGTKRQSGYFHDLFVAEILRVTENDQLAIVRRERTHDRLDFASPFATFAFLFRTQTA